MNGFTHAGIATLVVVGGIAAQQVPIQEIENPFQPFDREAFEAHAAEIGATAEQLEAFRGQVAELRLPLAADQLMRDLIPAFDNAVVLSEEGDPAAALALTKVLAGTVDPYLQGHVRYHLGRVFLDADDPERAVEIYNEYLIENRNQTALDAEVVYFYAQALADVPQGSVAAEVFDSYLQWFADVPERYRATAQQRLLELRSQADSPLHGIADEMKGVERWIRKTDTGEDTQKRQEGIIAQLATIIEELELQEQQTSGAPSGNTQSMNPAANSALPGGEARVGNLGRVSGVADRWGDLPDQDRKAIEADMQSALPPQYRKMLEEYYKKLGGRRR